MLFCSKIVSLDNGLTMNSRIKELSEQADLYARSDNSSMLFENYQKRYTEKLAQLIVTKCAEVVLDKNGPKGAGYVHQCREESADRIKEHFGVEE
jgi:hypothetical protein